jgi:hypothetical protein
MFGNQPHIHPVIDPDDQPTGEWDLFIGDESQRFGSRVDALAAKRAVAPVRDRDRYLRWLHAIRLDLR